MVDVPRGIYLVNNGYKTCNFVESGKYESKQ